jgi:hypothetical protein
MPIGAGFVVAYLQKWGFSPALKFLTRAIEGVVDDSKNAAYPTSYWQVSSLTLCEVTQQGSWQFMLHASLFACFPASVLQTASACILPSHSC